MSRAIEYRNINGALTPVKLPFLENQCPQTGKFYKGHTPWNKGIKGLQIGGKETQFKTGNEPHNTKYDGCISIRVRKRTNTPYKFIRLAKGKWILLHRYTFECVNGNIPPKHVVSFRDGNTLNCDIDNLELISMKENVLRNHNRKKASESMKKAWNSERIRAKYDLPRKTKLRV